MRVAFVRQGGVDLVEDWPDFWAGSIFAHVHWRGVNRRRDGLLVIIIAASYYFCPNGSTATIGTDPMAG